MSGGPNLLADLVRRTFDAGGPNPLLHRLGPKDGAKQRTKNMAQSWRTSKLARSCLHERTYHKTAAFVSVGVGVCKVQTPLTGIG